MEREEKGLVFYAGTTGIGKTKLMVNKMCTLSLSADENFNKKPIRSCYFSNSVRRDEFLDYVISYAYKREVRLLDTTYSVNINLDNIFYNEVCFYRYYDYVGLAMSIMEYLQENKIEKAFLDLEFPYYYGRQEMKALYKILEKYALENNITIFITKQIRADFQFNIEEIVKACHDLSPTSNYHLFEKNEEGKYIEETYYNAKNEFIDINYFEFDYATCRKKLEE